MAAPSDLLDPPAVMSYSGLVDASTAEGHGDDEADWTGVVSAINAPASDSQPGKSPARDLAHIIRRRGAYSPAR